MQATIAKQMDRVSPHGDRYIYTSHSFLLSLFLDCPPGMGLHCPNTSTKAAVEEAMRSGAITWHAHPHNAQYELYDTSLLEFSFELTHDLDRRFGVKRKHTAILVRHSRLQGQSLWCVWGAGEEGSIKLGRVGHIPAKPAWWWWWEGGTNVGLR